MYTKSSMCRYMLRAQVSTHLALEDFTTEEVVQEQVGQIGFLVKCLLDVAKETAIGGDRFNFILP